MLKYSLCESLKAGQHGFSTQVQLKLMQLQIINLRLIDAQVETFWLVKLSLEDTIRRVRWGKKQQHYSAMWNLTSIQHSAHIKPLYLTKRL